MSDLSDKVKSIFGKKSEMDTKNKPPKIYVGNAKLSDAYNTASLDITEILSHEEEFKSATISGENKLFLDVVILPFKAGTNKFGNTHYIIIKNR